MRRLWTSFMTGLAALVLLAGAPRAARAPRQEGFLDDLQEALDTAKDQGRPVFVHFTAPWCEACKEMKQRVYVAAPVRERLERFVPVFVDVEAPGGQALSRKHRVRNLPTLAFLNPGGEEARGLRLVGMQETGDLIRRLDEAIEKLDAPPAPAETSEAAGGAVPAGVAASDAPVGCLVPPNWPDEISP